MALNFPASPTDGQTYTDANTGNQYIYSTTYGYWQSISGSFGGGYYQGNRGDFASTNYGDIFRTHTNTLSGNVTVLSGNNSIAAGPLTISSGYKLEIQANARVAIV